MRVLVVDDSTLYRKLVRDALAAAPGVEIVGVAADGNSALEKIDQLQPDLVTLDQEMPGLDGLGVLDALRTRPTPPKVVMISSLTAAGAETTAKALRLGAFDFVLKPVGGSVDENRAHLQEGIARVLEAASTTLAQPSGRPPQRVAPPPAPAVSAQYHAPPKLVAIGVSTGGPAALAELLPRLPGDFPLPIVLVQHMPPVFTRSLADQLNEYSRLHVAEAADGDVCLSGHVYIAPGGRQMRIVPQGTQLVVKITDDPPEKSCRPSVDYLFRSVVDAVGARCLGVIMTGMGDDGADGSRLIKRVGGRVLAQDEASCVVYGMPRRVIEDGLADAIVPLQELPGKIMELSRGGAVLCS
ncbi:MAG: chemotaxis response regulator protein-glutamate methylesterase [Planctomycetales bacterium]|nr:chemotaxis response regulator protein-glutamate methylesterase [Planctomycetales bacterium]